MPSSKELIQPSRSSKAGEPSISGAGLSNLLDTPSEATPEPEPWAVPTGKGKTSKPGSTTVGK